MTRRKPSARFVISLPCCVMPMALLLSVALAPIVGLAIVVMR